jgi:hypothetical protein
VRCLLLLPAEVEARGMPRADPAREGGGVGAGVHRGRDEAEG